MEDATCSKSSDGDAHKYREGLQADFIAALEAMLSTHHERVVKSLQECTQIDSRAGRRVTFASQRGGERRGQCTEASRASSAPRDGLGSEEPDSLAGATSERRTSTFSKSEALKRFATLHVRPPTTRSSSASLGSSQEGGRRALQVAVACAKRTVLSDGFDVFMSLLILSNAVFCGVEVEYMAWSRLRQPPPVFYWVSLSYTVIFAVELALRFVGQGRSFFHGAHWKWNVFDLVIIVVSVLEACVDLGQGGGRALPSIRVIRMARLVRVLRIVRIMRHVRSLRILIYSVFNTLRSLLWTLVLLFVILFVFGLLFTQATTDHLLNPDHARISNLEEAYGTLGRSMFTLFKSISGGMNWEDTIQPLSQLHPLWMASYLLYFTFTYFAVLNVVTGVFCQTAIESAGQDHEMAAQAQLTAKQYYISQLERLFKRMNTNNTGFITLKEFEACIEDEQLRAYFSSIDLTIDEAFSLFKLLDRDGKHTLSTEAFVTGCLKLRGHAKPIDIAIMMYETRWSLQRCLKVVQGVRETVRDLQLGLQGEVGAPADEDDLTGSQGVMCL